MSMAVQARTVQGKPALGKTAQGRRLLQASLIAAVAVGLGACATTPSEAQTPPAQRSDDGGFLGIGNLFGGQRPEARAEIGVNSFLWRASLDTLSFMPLENADQIGGLIVTDWWSDPSAPDEWLKVQVYILDTRLRADGVKVQVHRRVGPTPASAQTAAVDPDTGLQIENAILTRARVLRLQTVGG
jgi:hypothetical protein